MANEIRIGIGVHGEDQAARDLGKVEKAADKVGDALGDMGDQATAAGKASDKAGDQFRDTADDAGHVKRRIDELTRSYQGLLKEFNSTGDESLLKQATSDKRQLRKFTNIGKDLFPDAEVVKAGQSLAVRLAEGFRTGSAALKGAAVPAIAGLAVVAAPAIGAIIAGAVLGGVGIGGIAGGIALAAQDERVKSAASQVGETLASEFQNAADPFVEPVLRALGKVGNAKWAEKLAPTFDKLAAKVDPLTDGLLGLVDRAIPGLERLADAAGPTLDVIASELPEIGAAFSNFLGDLSEDPEQAAQAIKGLLNGIEDTLDKAGDFIAFLVDTYNVMHQVNDALGFGETRLSGWKKGADDASGSNYHFGNTAEDAAREVADLNKEIDRFLGKLFGLEEVQDNAADAFARLAEQIKRQREEGVKGAGSLEGQTQAARDNRAAARGLADIYGELIIKTAEAGGSLEDLRQQFVNAGIEAGLSRKEVEKLANKLFELPREVVIDVWIKTHGARAFNAILSGVESVLATSPNSRARGARASGGPVAAGGAYLVGENGPELLTMGSSAGYVHNAGQTRGMLSGQSGGATQATLSLKSSGNAALDQLMAAFATYLRVDIRDSAGGSAETYFA